MVRSETMSRKLLFFFFASMVMQTASFYTHLSTIRQKCVLSSTTSADSDLAKPKWAGGGDIVSDIVNSLISIKPLFAVMKVAARSTLISTAEKKGVPWRERTAALTSEKSNLQQFYDQVENKLIGYPTYYTQEFHAYDEGNLNWNAAYECESATMAMALRVWPKDGLTAEAAQDRLRYSFMDAVEGYYQNKVDSTSSSGSKTSDSNGNGLADLAQTFFKSLSSSTSMVTKSRSSSPTKIIDIGCSVGVSTFYLAERFRQASVIDALDLSPHFLAVAKQRQDYVASAAAATITAPSTPPSLSESVNQGLTKFLSSGLGRIRWLHGNAEATGLPSNSYDLTAASFVFHELPQAPSNVIIQELYRITSKGGGVVAITDNNPRSPVIQGLPPVLFTLMKSTEPWSDEYYSFDMEEALRVAGFTDVTTIATDPRHRTVLGRKI